MSHRRPVRPTVFTADEWRAHQAEDERLRQQNKLLRNPVMDLCEKIHALEGRSHLLSLKAEPAE